MISPDLLAQHFEYSLWASLKVLEVAEKLSTDVVEKDRGNSFGGILGTLTHVFQADRIWWKRFTGQPYSGLAIEGEVLDLAALRQEWPAVMQGFVKWIRSQEAGDLEQRLEWRNLKGDGEERSEIQAAIACCESWDLPSRTSDHDDQTGRRRCGVDRPVVLSGDVARERRGRSLFRRLRRRAICRRGRRRARRLDAAQRWCG